MPDTLTLTLLLFVGIAAGVLITLVIDSLYLDRRIQQEKNKLLRLQNKVEMGEAQVKHLREDLEDAEGWREQASHLLEDKEELEEKLATAESHIRQLEAQVKGTLLQLTETQSLRKQIAAAEADNRGLKAQLKETQNQLVYLRLEGKEDLTLIKGIGPAYARRLEGAGIKTLADLALADPTHVGQVVQLKQWQNAEPVKWIAEAKELAAVFADEEE